MCTFKKNQCFNNPTSKKCGNFKVFHIIQILCEINFEQSTSSKTAVFAILGALKFANLVNFLPSKST